MRAKEREAAIVDRKADEESVGRAGDAMRW